MSAQATANDSTYAVEVLRAALKSQYHAALAMLRQAIERCPDSLWSSRDYLNPFWRIAYHALYYSHLYIQPNTSAFRPWEHHQTGLQHMDDIPGPPDIEAQLELPDRPLQTGEPYTKQQLLAYWSLCDRMVDDVVDALDLLDPESGFSWKKMSRVEHQMAAVRHIQHHTAQLADRVRAATNSGIDWVSARTVTP